MNAGVYVIVNTVTGEEYIGKSMDFKERWRQHKTLLRSGVGNRFLQKAWNTYGESAFAFKILEVCYSGSWPWLDSHLMDEAEARYIAERKPVYNVVIPYTSGERRQVVTMTWPAELADKVDAAAQAHDMTRVEFVMRVLNEWLANE